VDRLFEQLLLDLDLGGRLVERRSVGLDRDGDVLLQVLLRRLGLSNGLVELALV